METKTCAFCRDEQPHTVSYGCKAVVIAYGTAKAWMEVLLDVAELLEEYGADDTAVAVSDELDGETVFSSSWRINYCPMCGRSLVDVDWEGGRTMPTTDERREVAARLRGKRPRACVRGVLGWELACGDFECCEDCSRFAMSDLADLIEPSERTCRNVGEREYEDDRSFTCSECDARGPYGEGIYHLGGREEIDGSICFWDAWPVWKFCPNCGAKVVE